MAEYYVHLLHSCVPGFIQLAMPLVDDGLAGTKLDGNLVPSTATRQTSGVATRLGWTDSMREPAMRGKAADVLGSTARQRCLFHIG